MQSEQAGKRLRPAAAQRLRPDLPSTPGRLGTTLHLMASETEPEQVLTCPDCEQAHAGTKARIGNRKTTCRTCNRFAQAVRRYVARALMEAHPDEVVVLRAAAERDAYGMVVGSTDTARRGSTEAAGATP